MQGRRNSAASGPWLEGSVAVRPCSRCSKLPVTVEQQACSGLMEHQRVEGMLKVPQRNLAPLKIDAALVLHVLVLMGGHVRKWATWAGA